LLGGHVGIVFICSESKVDLRGRVILIVHSLRIHIEVPQVCTDKIRRLHDVGPAEARLFIRLLKILH
jgi:hypothetical protein